ncbi:hypothetical protein [Butyrivibrio sp. AE2032]|jgi:hypothetical protein|uniref:hypothetical protein n=1 Tax=Butyrivibrio sp. AE2032 TaxID=1458463 RepID=UPI000557E108|nr:hypothetical protein [Butyrivibrio sp. AE2032]
MADIDPMTLKSMAKLKNANEADELIRGMKEPGNESDIKGEYQALKEVEELTKLVEKQTYLLHAFWIMLKEKGATNEELDKALNEAILFSKRKDYKTASVCPSCNKPLQTMENKPFTSKCYYCGTEILENPYRKFDGIDPYQTGYPQNESTAPEGPYVSDSEADEQEFKSAQDVISQSFEPYDVTKDLHFDDEET